MSAFGSAFDGAVIDDLAKAAAALLDPGVAPKLRAPRHRDLPGTLGGLLSDVRSLTGLVPRLLDELEKGHDHSETVLEHSRTPLRASPSRRASDYVQHDDQLIPKHYLSPVPILETDCRPLSWLLWLLEKLDQRARRHQTRFAELLDEALSLRQIDSPFAREEVQELRAIERSIGGSIESLRRARERVSAKGSWRISPSPTRPSIYPQGPSWTSLRALAETMTSPGKALRRAVIDSLQTPVHLADRPYLYQRWVGLKLVQALQKHGWQVSGDVIGALFLGGPLTATREATRLEVWFEPRLIHNHSHPSGLRATTGEAAPDIVLVTPGPSNRDAFVIDPTLAKATHIRLAKGKYLKTIEFSTPAQVAGVVTAHRPLRAWAAVPEPRSECTVYANKQGRTGYIPMWPGDYNAEPLQLWLGDVLAHAQAWT